MSAVYVSTLSSVLVGDGKYELASEPLSLVRYELPRDVIEYGVDCVRLNVIDINPSAEVRMSCDVTSPSCLSSSCIASKEQTSCSETAPAPSWQRIERAQRGLGQRNGGGSRSDTNGLYLCLRLQGIPLRCRRTSFAIRPVLPKIRPIPSGMGFLRLHVPTCSCRSIGVVVAGT